jgi:hypothetical protein
MSKTVTENISTFSDRIIKILKDNGLIKKDGSVNFSAAERKCRMKGTILQKAVKRNSGLYDDNLDKFLGTFQVRKEWLLNGEGDIYDKKHTPGIKDDQPAISREERLIATLERAVDSLGRQNMELIQIVKNLTGKVPVSNSGE